MPASEMHDVRMTLTIDGDERDVGVRLLAAG